jgi:hypothetical protein
MANRGVWEAIDSASPAVSLAAEEADINFYLSVYETCLDELTTQRNRTDHRASHGTERTIFDAGVTDGDVLGQHQSGMRTRALGLEQKDFHGAVLNGHGFNAVQYLSSIIARQ